MEYALGSGSAWRVRDSVMYSSSKPYRQIPYSFSGFVQKRVEDLERRVTGLFLGQVVIDTEFIKIETITDSFDLNGTLISKVIPEENVAPTGAGLYLGADYLGYYDSSNWKTYMDSSGNFYLGGTSGALQWNGSTLSITGVITVSAGSNVEVGADVTATHTAASITGQGTLATLNAVGAANCNTTIISGGKIITGLLTANNIQAGNLAVARLTANTITATYIYSEAYLGGKRLNDYAGGSFVNMAAGAISANVTHNLGRNAIVNCWGSVTTRQHLVADITHTTSKFNVVNNGGAIQTVYYEYL